MINKLDDAVINITLETEASLFYVDAFLTTVKRALVSILSEFLDSEIQEKKKILKIEK